MCSPKHTPSKRLPNGANDEANAENHHGNGEANEEAVGHSSRLPGHHENCQSPRLFKRKHDYRLLISNRFIIVFTRDIHKLSH